MTQTALRNDESEIGARYLSFSLGAQSYAIPLLTVREVIAVPEITPVPTMPSYFLGIMNLRGQVISVIDLGKKMGITPADSSEVAVIICAIGTVCLGLIVDSINSVIAPEEANISMAPVMCDVPGSDYVLKVFRDDNELTLLMDIARVLNVDDHKVAARPVPGQTE